MSDEGELETEARSRWRSSFSIMSPKQYRSLAGCAAREPLELEDNASVDAVLLPIYAALNDPARPLAPRVAEALETGATLCREVLSQTRKEDEDDGRWRRQRALAAAGLAGAEELGV